MKAYKTTLNMSSKLLKVIQNESKNDWTKQCKVATKVFLVHPILDPNTPDHLFSRKKILTKLKFQKQKNHPLSLWVW